MTFTTEPTTAGSLTASVTTDHESSGTAVQVATVTPVVTSSTASLVANLTTITITGFGFDATAGHNTLVFSDGAAGTITSSTATSLTVSFTAKPTTAGILTLAVTTDSESSGSAVQVATVTPVVFANTGNLLAANATTVTIIGLGFDSTAANDTVAFNDGAVGTVASATATSLTVNLTTSPAAAGSLTAVVTIDSVNNGSAIQVAQVTPVVTNSAANVGANASTITINGFGFDPTASNNTVTFNDGAHGTVTSATSTSLTVTLSTDPTTAGNLTGSVTADTVSSGAAVQVATVTPVVTSSTANLPANASTITINGFGFDSAAGNNKVTFTDGAVGTVTTATATSLTVTFSVKPTTAGSLTAVVTSNNVSSGSAVQVAPIAPVVLANTGNLLAANATTITLNGSGFDTTLGNNTVNFNNGAVGTVIAATATSLTVSFSTKPTTAGSLTAFVVVDGVSSGAAVQVATVVPVVTSSTSSLAANASTITITGFGFDPTAGSNTVTFNNGATGTVTAATPTSLTVTFSANPTTAGSLTAIVATDTVSSGAAIQVATVTPVVTSSVANLPAGTSEVTINGFGFDSTPAHNTVVFNDGAVGTVTSATPTSLTVTFSTEPIIPGNLTAAVTTDGVSSGTAVQVATVVPVVTSSSVNLAANATSITINGFGFDTTAANNTVTFNDGAVYGTVTSASATSLTVTFTTSPTTAGSLTAIVTTDSVSSGSAVQVATVMPVVTNSAASLAADSTSITINGFGFDPTAASNIVAFNDGAFGTVTAATPTSLTVTLTTSPTTAGSLTAVVTTDTVSSGTAIQVATVTPVVTSSTASQAATSTTVTINGFGFDSTPGNNTVTFSDGSVGTVTSASATSLTVTFSIKPTTAGTLTAVVTSDGVSSGTAVQVAAVAPVVLANTAYHPAANATTITINGIGFDTTAANNTVVFNNGAVGTVNSATPTSLTVTLSTGPTTAGSLTAIVTTDSVSSGAAVQVATVTPVVTSSSTSLPANAATITINGFGFDPTATSNTVMFNNGAVGTVTSATPTSLLVTFSTAPTIVGNLTAVVTVDGLSSGAAVQVATVAPVVTSSTTTLATTATTITINGFGFDSTAAQQHGHVQRRGGRHRHLGDLDFAYRELLHRAGHGGQPDRRGDHERCEQRYGNPSGHGDAGRDQQFRQFGRQCGHDHHQRLRIRYDGRQQHGRVQ